jgi:cytochrome P450
MSEESKRPIPDCPHTAATYDPLSPEELRDPYPSFELFRREAPVFYSERNELWTIARQEDVLAVLKDTENFSNTAALPSFDPPDEIRERVPEFPWVGSVLLLDDPEHRPERKVVQAPFTLRNVNGRADAIRALVNELLDPFERTGSIEFVKGFCYPLSLGVTAEILGIPSERFPLLERGVEAAFLLRGSGLTEHDEIVQASLVFAELYEYIHELVEERARHPGDDYISIMVRTPRDDGSLESPAKMIKRVWTLIGAGFETTANQLANGFRTLLEHRDQWELLLANRELVDNAVEEMLRFSTLMKRLLRTAVNDVIVGGVQIPKGARVALLVGSANRDQDGYDDDPDIFDISRRRDHLTFGKWKHFCVGAPLARLELRIATDVMADRFRDAEVVPDQHPAQRPDIRIQAMSHLYLERTRIPTNRSPVGRLSQEPVNLTPEQPGF